VLELLEPLLLQIVAASHDLPYLHADFHRERKR
jgi:hypothetical protein